ncbi:MAG: extracellular solute-binding protein family 1 [Paenibacillus sp.]|jgi:ABC-type glycerol-3-phosphate transport system substrate-binding protein|nr:extracellular solute-binding protein family 1 [Paenibacillus sp.]
MAAGTVAALAAVSMLAGCGGSKEPQNSPDGTAATGKPKEISFLMSDLQNAYAKEMRPGDKYVQELSKLSGYSLKYEFLDHNNYGQQLTLRFASGQLPDVIFTGSIDSSSHANAVENGIFTELGPLIDKYGPNLKKHIPEEAWKSPSVSKNGKIYGIPSFSATYPSSRVIYIRQDWLDKLGMKAPKSLDDFLAYFEKVKQNDMNGNGDPNDEIPFYARENLGYSEAFFGHFGVFPGVWTYKDGQMTPDVIDPRMKEAISFYKLLYDKGYMNRDVFTTKSGDWFNNISTGKAGMWLHDVQNLMSSFNPDTKFPNQSNVKLDMLGGPTRADGKSYLHPGSTGIKNVFVIPSSVEHPEEIIKYFDWAWSDSPEKDKFLSFGIKDVNYSEKDGKVQWDSAAAVNADKNAISIYQLVLNPVGDGRLSEQLIAINQHKDLIAKGKKLANDNAMSNDSLHMPVLSTLQTHPELAVGGGSLFMDMVAKAVTGKEEVDKAFETFTSEWKRRGGNDAIKEATAWYKSFNGK